MSEAQGQRRPNHDKRNRDNRPQNQGGGQNNSPNRQGQNSSGGKRRRRPGNKKSPRPDAQVDSAQQASVAKAPKAPEKDYSVFRPGPQRKIGFLLYETFMEARNHRQDIVAATNGCDQLNVVIRAEGDMSDPELTGLSPKVKVFAGAAWALIHERRLEERWYESLH